MGGSEQVADLALDGAGAVAHAYVLSCRLSHVTPGKPDLLALGMAALPRGTEVSVETGSAALCVDWRSIHTALSLPRTGTPAKASAETGVAAVGSA